MSFAKKGDFLSLTGLFHLEVGCHGHDRNSERSSRFEEEEEEEEKLLQIDSIKFPEMLFAKKQKKIILTSSVFSNSFKSSFILK